jgi:hypothetical protein
MDILDNLRLIAEQLTGGHVLMDTRVLVSVDCGSIVTVEGASAELALAEFVLRVMEERRELPGPTPAVMPAEAGIQAPAPAVPTNGNGQHVPRGWHPRWETGRQNRERVRPYFEQGWSASRIATETGISVDNVRYYIKTLRKNGGEPSPAEDAPFPG